VKRVSPFVNVATATTTCRFGLIAALREVGSWGGVTATTPWRQQEICCGGEFSCWCCSDLCLHGGRTRRRQTQRQRERPWPRRPQPWSEHSSSSCWCKFLHSVLISQQQQEQ